MVIYIPAHLIHAYESNQEKLKFQDPERKFEDVDRIIKRGNEIKCQYVKYIRTELGFEVVFQIAGQILLLMQSITETSTVNGLGKDSIHI